MKRNLVPNLLFLMVMALFYPAIAASPGAPTVKVTGEVSRPGVYAYHKGDKASVVICQAGITLTSDLSRVKVIRPVKGADTSIPVDAGWMFTTTRVSSSSQTGMKDVELKPGDTINVPSVGPQNITRNLKDVPLAAALESILKDSGVNYSIDPALQNSNLKVTAVLKNVSLDSALKTIIGASGISYQVGEDNVLKFTPGPSYNPDGNKGRVTSGFGSQEQSSKADSINSTGTERTADTNASGDADRVVQIIPLKYLRAGDAVPLVINLRGISSVQTSGDSALVVAGTRDALKQAVGVLSQVDVQSAYPRIIRVYIDVKLTAGDASQTLKTESVGLEGEQIPLKLEASFPVDGKTKGTVVLDAAIRPEYDSSTTPGKISIAGSGNIVCSIPVVAVVNNPPADFRQPFIFVSTITDTPTSSKGTAASSTEVDVNGRKVGYVISVRAQSEGRTRKVSAPRVYGPMGGMRGGAFPPGAGRISDGSALKGGAPSGGGFRGMSPGTGRISDDSAPKSAAPSGGLGGMPPGARIQEPKK